MSANSTHTPGTTEHTKPHATESLHRDFLEAAMPAWLIEASTQRRQAIKQAGTQAPPWYTDASPEQRKVLDACFKESVTAQVRLDKALSSFLDVDAFARPLLVQALKDQYKLEVDVDKTVLCLRRPLAMGVLEIEVSSFEQLKLPMLQAALHNFESWECAPGAYHASSGFAVETDTPGTFVPAILNLSVDQFLTLCRSLDIGAKYQVYLNAFFYPADTATETTLREHFITSQKATMRAAAEQALLMKDIEPRDYAMILSVINGENHPWMDKKQVWFQDLAVMKQRLVGCVAFSIFEKYHSSNEVILYVPHDPEHPLKRYDSEQLNARFRQSLTTPDTWQSKDAGPTPYQRFFSQFVPYEKRPYFFSQFVQEVTDSFSYPLRSPWNYLDFANPFAVLTEFKELPPLDSTLQREPEPYISPSTMPQQGRAAWADNLDPWNYLYDRHREKVLADARCHAVPTDDVDVKAREAKLAHLLQLGLMGLNLVSMFVPVLGEVMMVVMAGQLLYETVEGVTEWQEGDKRAAKAHLIDVAENLALIGVMAGAGAGFSKLAAMKAEPVIERLEPVVLPNGETRLWKPDLGSYESSVTRDTLSVPNALGQYEVDGKTYFLQGDKVYEQFFDESIHKWRIRHPTDPNAYQPILVHNGSGAWRHSLERPMAWDRLTLLRRIGHDTVAFSDSQLLKLADISGVSDNTLRKMHLDHTAPPPELRDAMRLFKADADTGQVIEQLRGVTPIDERYMHALPLVTEMPRWPSGRVLELFQDPGLSGKSIKYGVERSLRGEANRPAIRLSRQDVLGGQLPRRILDGLDESEIVLLLGEEGARVHATRPDEFSRQLADHAGTRQSTIFDTLYEGPKPVQGRARMLQAECPGLSEAAADEVIAHGSLSDLARLDATRRSPLNMLEEARWYARQGRQVRAYAGLRRENIASADSRRLALNALEKLPGWPGTLRLEVREGSERGTLLGRAGDASAADKRYLIKNGPRYQVYNEGTENFNGVRHESGDLYSAIVQALPDDARSALGLPDVGQGAALQRRIIDYADLHREDMPWLMEPYTKRFKPPVRVSATRIGYYASGRGSGGARAMLKARIAELYPGQGQVEAFFRQHGNKTDHQVYTIYQERAREWANLEGTLDRWQASVPHSFQKLEVSRALKEAWRNRPLAEGLTGEITEVASLSLSCEAPLSEMTVDFPHVRELTINGSGLTDTNANAFLAHFPGVTKLSIGGRESAYIDLSIAAQPLTTLPAALDQMPGLTNLRFSSTAPQLASDFRERLIAQASLESLHINYSGFDSATLHNLDLAPLSRLRSLKIDAPYVLTLWPEYVQRLPRLEYLDLTRTSIQTLPDTLFEGHETLWAGLSLNWSRLDPEAFRRAFRYVSSYAGEHGHLVDLHNMVDEYCRGQLQFMIGTGEFMGRLPERFIALETPLQRFDALEVIREEHEAIFGQFYEPTELGGRSRAIPTLQWRQEGESRLLQALQSSWRSAVRQRLELPGESVHRFELPPSRLGFAGEIRNLPVLPVASFSHVRTLSLGALGGSLEQARNFFRAFSGTQALEISDSRFTELPFTADAMPALTQLDMRNNRLLINPTVQAQFNGLRLLETLNLQDNPLNTLDVSALTQLRALNLNGTRLQGWPTGAETLAQLSWLDLRNNQLQSLPASVLANDEILLKLNVTRNPFSPEGKAALSAAQQRVGDAKGLPQGALARLAEETVPPQFPPAETGWSLAHRLLSLPERSALAEGEPGFALRLQRLNPDMTPEQAALALRQWREGGMTVEQIDARLSQWHEACETLTRQLNGWLYSRPIRTIGDDIVVSAHNREVAARSIRKVWQEGLTRIGDPGQTLNLHGLELGDLPVLAERFPGVATLDLSGVLLTEQGANGFLASFPDLRRLNLSGNYLHGLPAAVLQMAQLERLELAFNNLPYADIYSLLRIGRLRVLDVGGNGLDVFDPPGFGQLETLDLSQNQIDRWPRNLLSAQRLRELNLSMNELRDIPAQLLDGTHETLLAGMDLTGNEDLSLSALEALRDYSDAHDRANVAGFTRDDIENGIRDMRRREELGGSSSDGDSDGSDGDDPAAVQPVEPIHNPGADTSTEALEPWLVGSSTEQASARTRIWTQLANEEGHERFFQLLTFLRNTTDYASARAELTRRVWNVLEAASDDRELRQLQFQHAETHGTCIDGRRLVFSDMEVRTYVYHALRDIPLGQHIGRGQALLRLSRQLFRLDRAETLAEVAEMASRRGDPAEARLQYRIGLATGWGDGIDLPEQPVRMAFRNAIAGEELKAARHSILEAERGDALLEDMVTREYWTSYLRDRYPEEMAALDTLEQRRDEALGDLEDGRATGLISDAQYNQQLDELSRTTARSRKQELLAMTRKELDYLKNRGPGAEPPGNLSPQPGPSWRD